MEKTYENWLVVSDIDGTLNNKFRKLPKKKLRRYQKIYRFRRQFYPCFRQDGLQP